MDPKKPRSGVGLCGTQSFGFLRITKEPITTFNENIILSFDGSHVQFVEDVQQNDMFHHVYCKTLTMLSKSDARASTPGRSMTRRGGADEWGTKNRRKEGQGNEQEA